VGYRARAIAGRRIDKERPGDYALDYPSSKGPGLSLADEPVLNPAALILPR